MKAGGVIRVGVPNLERYIKSYLGGDPIINAVRPGRPTSAIAFSEIYLFHGHQTMYDVETLTLLLHEAGFRDAESSDYGTGWICPSPDSEFRKAETLYVQARA